MQLNSTIEKNYMKQVNLLLIFFASILFCACEQEVANPNLLYEPKLVVRAFLFANETPNGITVSMMQHPLASSNNLQNSFIRDAEVIISTQGINYKCNFDGTSYYCDDLLLQAGQTYHLSVKYKGMTATATTIIPAFEIDSVYYNVKESGNYWYRYRGEMYAKISSPQPLSCYATKIVYYAVDANNTSYYHYETMINYNPSSNSDILLDINGAYSLASFNHWANSWRHTFIAFDEQMHKYYTTSDNNEDWDLFGTSGVNPIWNVKGDGIGLFIGGNKKEIRYRDYN